MKVNSSECQKARKKIVEFLKKAFIFNASVFFYKNSNNKYVRKLFAYQEFEILTTKIKVLQSKVLISDICNKIRYLRFQEASIEIPHPFSASAQVIHGFQFIEWYPWITSTPVNGIVGNHCIITDITVFIDSLVYNILESKNFCKRNPKTGNLPLQSTLL